MSPLRVLRRVSRFPARNEQFFDPLAFEALNEVSGPNGRAFIKQVQQDWHRPSGDTNVLEANLAVYGEPSPPRCWQGDYLALLKKTLDEIAPSEPLIPLTLGAAEKHPQMPTSTSPGFPWVNQGYRTKRDVFASKQAVGHIHRAWDSIGRGVNWSLPDCMAFHRVIASPREKTKIRPVWGFPTEVIVEEARWFYPLLEHLKPHCNERDTFYGLGLETALSGHSHLARSFDNPAVKCCLNADLSQFDAHVPAWIIRDVFAHVSSWFDFSKVKDSEGKVWNVNPAQTCRRWKAMVSYFINTKIRTPSGFRFQKFQGVPSGSLWTNFMDTAVNAIQMRTCLRRVTGDYPVKDYYYGDDSSIFLRDSIDLDALATELEITFGGILSVDKTTLTDNVENIHWLGYYYRPTGPRRPLEFILASTLYPDREVVDPLDCCARLLGQLYSTMDPVVSVIFYDAVTYIMRKFSLSRYDVESFIRELPSKAMKYLTTLGMDISEVVVPPIGHDPFGGRFCMSVLPKPSARNYFRFRDPHLPRYAFAPEAYSNVFLRTLTFSSFEKYIETFSSWHDFAADEPYFTS